MNVQRFALNDGPGIRTTVFLKGCNLRCPWCHNPESREIQPEVLYHAAKCAHCAECRFDLTGDCLHDAKELCGTLWTPDTLIETLLRDKKYFDRGGGVTFSGGEALLQADFVAECMRALKEVGVHTCLDSALCVSTDALDKVLPFTDLVLADLKCMDPVIHKHVTGRSNHLVLANIAHLNERGIPMWVRMPLADGVNADDMLLEKAARFLMPLSSVQRVDLIPVLNHAEDKFRSLGLQMPRFNENIDSSALIRHAYDVMSAASSGKLTLHCMI